MAPTIDLVELADELTEIASTTSDSVAAVRLMELANRLLTAAGLPDDDTEGGGDLPPSHWNHAAPVDAPEYA